MSQILHNGKVIRVPVLEKEWAVSVPVAKKVEISDIMFNAMKALSDVTMNNNERETYNRLRTAIVAIGINICEAVERGYAPELKEFAVTISVPSTVVVYKEAATEEEARKLVESGLAAGQTIQKVEEFK